MKLIFKKPVNVKYTCICGVPIEVVIGPRPEFVTKANAEYEGMGRVKIWASEAVSQIQCACGRSEPILKLILAPMGVEIVS